MRHDPIRHANDCYAATEWLAEGAHVSMGVALECLADCKWNWAAARAQAMTVAGLDEEDALAILRGTEDDAPLE